MKCHTPKGSGVKGKGNQPEKAKRNEKDIPRGSKGATLGGYRGCSGKP